MASSSPIFGHLGPGPRAAHQLARDLARRVPYVNVQHPERSADVVLFLDTFAEAEHAEEGTLDAAVQAAAALASAYLARRDRVALVSFGGTLNWLTASAGTRQLYRIVDALIASDVRLSFAWKDVTHLPPRLLPARALVLALSPLLDARGIAALLDLRARGYDLAWSRSRRWRTLRPTRPGPTGCPSGSGACSTTPCARASKHSASPSLAGSTPAPASSSRSRR